MRRLDSRVWTLLTIAFAVGVLVGVTSAVQIAPRITNPQAVLAVGPDSSSDPQVIATATSKGIARGSAQPLASGITPRPGLECARGRNGGSTDVGVSGDTIQLATTTVESGIGAAFLGEAKYAMEAVRQKVNRAGGICGRLLEIKYVDDGWEGGRGSNYIRNFIQSGVFAIPVAPSSEGLRFAIEGHDIDRAGIPVVGSDGMLIDQYTDPWVWPIAVATATSARIMARNAYKRGARTFSIVFDNNYKFGIEAADAYNKEVRKLTGKNVDGYNANNNCSSGAIHSYCGIIAGQSSYATEVQGFTPGQFVAMFLEPQTALTWMSTAKSPKPGLIPYGIGAGQPLFTRDFANSCQASCHGMRIWTGYRPPIESYANEPSVRKFVNDLHQTNTHADESNAFTMGAYAGMNLLIAALKAVGPDLTRLRLKAALDAIVFDDGLTLEKPLRWAPNHFANNTMQAFAIQYKGTFSGWRGQDIEQAPR